MSSSNRVFLSENLDSLSGKADSLPENPDSLSGNQDFLSGKNQSLTGGSCERVPAGSGAERIPYTPPLSALREARPGTACLPQFARRKKLKTGCFLCIMGL